jgi:methionyl-tRNA synthetase
VQSRRKEFVHCDHEYLNFKGSKFSQSRGAAVEVPYFLSKYDPDPLRFYLTATAPETRDTEFSWEDFVERNNNELVATHSLRSVHSWGNLCQRPRTLGFMLSFAYKRFDGRVPEPGPLDDEDRALLEKVAAGFEMVGDLYNACKFRAALHAALVLAREANGYTFASLPSVPSGQAVQAWTARRPGSRSRRTGPRQRQQCTPSCGPWTT